jgi:hypothetical protein
MTASQTETLYHVTYRLARGPLGPQTVHRNIRARNAAHAFDLALRADGVDEVTDLDPTAEGHVRKAHR